MQSFLLDSYIKIWNKNIAWVSFKQTYWWLVKLICSSTTCNLLLTTIFWFFNFRFISFKYNCSNPWWSIYLSICRAVPSGFLLRITSNRLHY